MGFWRVFLTLWLVAALPATSSWARTGQAYIDSVHLRRGPRSEVLLSFRVQRAFDSRLLDTLDSGLPLRFTYSIRVEQPREVLRDRVLADFQLDRTLVKDNLKDRYRVTNERGEKVNLSSLSEATEAMVRVDGVRVFSAEALGRQPLLLKVRAKLQKFQLPFRLHYLLAFVSYWDVDTDWYVLELPEGSEALP